MIVQQVSAYVQRKPPSTALFRRTSIFLNNSCVYRGPPKYQQTSHSRIFLLEICWWH